MCVCVCVCVCACVCSQLEEGHTGRLERTEDLWLRVRKDHAPRLARLSLESRSLRDVLLHGTPPPPPPLPPTQPPPPLPPPNHHHPYPQPNHHHHYHYYYYHHTLWLTLVEGNPSALCLGQASPSWAESWAVVSMGVVYLCDTWGGNYPCALKSVVPPRRQTLERSGPGVPLHQVSHYQAVAQVCNHGELNWWHADLHVLAGFYNTKASLMRIPLSHVMSPQPARAWNKTLICNMAPSTLLCVVPAHLTLDNIHAYINALF